MMPKHNSQNLPRAKAQVYEYLETLFDAKPGTRLPTTKAVADKIKVSISTVQAVYQGLARDGVIRSEIGNGTFLVRSPKTMPSSGIRVGITFGFSDNAMVSEPWHLAVCGSLLAQASYQEKEVAIVPMQLDPDGISRMGEMIEERGRGVDGVIIRSISSTPEQAIRLPKPSIPYVTLRPELPNSTTNFVSSDIFSSGYKAGKAFLTSGRKSILVIHHGEPKLASNTMLLCSGIVSALGNALCSDVEFRINSVASTSQQDTFALLERIWQDPTRRPDAIYSRQMEITQGVLKFLQSKGVACPEEVSLIGTAGLNFHEPGNSGLTVFQSNTEAIAAGLLGLLLRRIENNGRSEPGIYIPEILSGHATTLPIENEVLGLPIWPENKTQKLNAAGVHYSEALT